MNGYFLKILKHWLFFKITLRKIVTSLIFFKYPLFSSQDEYFLLAGLKRSYERLIGCYHVGQVWGVKTVGLDHQYGQSDSRSENSAAESDGTTNRSSILAISNPKPNDEHVKTIALPFIDFLGVGSST